MPPHPEWASFANADRAVWGDWIWYPEGDPHRGLKKGHLDFVLEGEKLHGRFHLVRMHGRPGEKKEKEDALAKGASPDATPIVPTPAAPASPICPPTASP